MASPKSFISMSFILPNCTKSSECFNTNHTSSFPMQWLSFILIEFHSIFISSPLYLFRFVCYRPSFIFTICFQLLVLLLASQLFLLDLIPFLWLIISFSTFFSNGLWVVNSCSHFMWNTLISPSLFGDCNSKRFSNIRMHKNNPVEICQL